MYLFYNLKDNRHWFIKDGTLDELKQHMNRYQDDKYLLLPEDSFDESVKEQRIFPTSEIINILIRMRNAKLNAKGFVKQYTIWREKQLEVNLNKSIKKLNL